MRPQPATRNPHCHDPELVSPTARIKGPSAEPKAHMQCPQFICLASKLVAKKLFTIASVSPVPMPKGTAIRHRTRNAVVREKPIYEKAMTKKQVTMMTLVRTFFETFVLSRLATAQNPIMIIDMIPSQESGTPSSSYIDGHAAPSIAPDTPAPRKKRYMTDSMTIVFLRLSSSFFFMLFLK